MCRVTRRNIVKTQKTKIIGIIKRKMRRFKKGSKLEKITKQKGDN